MMCSKLLQSFSEFRSQCLESNVYFAEIEGKELIKELVAMQDTDKDVKPLIPVKEEFKPYEIEKFQEENPEEEEEFIEIQVVPSREILNRSMRKPRKHSKSNESPVKKKKKENDISVSKEKTRPSDFFMCEHCPEKLFTNKQYYREHLKIHKAAKLECHFCGLKYRSKYFLLGHIDRNHLEKDYGKRGDFACTLCPKRYLTQVRLKKHLGIHKLLRKPCPHCGELVKNLCSHMAVHNTTERFQCDKCEKSYKSQQHLQIHAVVHQNKLFVSLSLFFNQIQFF